jgi:LysR family transcriptional regulator, cyn operon transcriptional activator
MNLRYLQTFTMVAEVGSIARVGARLNVSQPAASRQILALEAELGVHLFDRIGRRLRLTAEGEDLLRQSRRVLMEADLLNVRARALRGGHTGILRVGGTPMAIESTLSVFTSGYQQRYPAVEVRLVEDGGLRLFNRLEQGDIHLALVVPDSRFCNRLLYPVHNLAVFSPKHRLSRRGALDVANLADEPMLLLQHGFGSREWFDAACDIAHIRPRVLLESAAPQAIISLAAVGYGVGVVPSTAVIPKSVRALPLVQRKMTIGRWLSIAWDPRRSLAAYAQHFIEELVAFCKRTYPGREFARRTPPLPRP